LEIKQEENAHPLNLDGETDNGADEQSDDEEIHADHVYAEPDDDGVVMPGRNEVLVQNSRLQSI
jgi:hypothetical protein